MFLNLGEFRTTDSCPPSSRTKTASHTSTEHRPRVSVSQPLTTTLPSEPSPRSSNVRAPQTDIPHLHHRSPSPSPSPSYPDRRSIACPVCGHISTTKRDMQRHIDDKHDDRPEDLSGTGWSLSPEMTCPYAACGGCEFKYRRKDRLKRHEETVHRR